MSSEDHGSGLFSKFDVLIMLGAIVTLFIASGSETWWSLNGASTSKLFSIQVSPFFVHINAIGLPSTVPLASSLGAFTRTFLLIGFVALFIASIRPTAWYRNIALYFGVSSLAELYLSFVLMFYWTESAFVNSYGILPPYFGTTALPAKILGLDLTFYTTPLVTASFGIPYYLGFISLGLLGGRSVVKVFRERALQMLAGLIPGGRVHNVYLTPPYQQVWFSSGDKEFNPMFMDPARVRDDELLVSFEKLYETIEPGGSLSIILPDDAVSLTDRLEKLMPQTGFTIEKTTTIYRTPGKPENEIRYRKLPAEPVVPVKADAIATTSIVEEPSPISEGLEKLDKREKSPEATPPIPTSESEEKERPKQIQPEPILEVVAKPVWIDKRMTRLERSMVKSAVGIVSASRQPVPYRELLNQVYMDLVDRKIEFDSARQIEAALLDHNGRELQLLEEADETGGRSVRKWWLGEQKLSPDKRPHLPNLGRVKGVRPKLPRIFKRSRTSRYRESSDESEDSNSDSGRA